MFWQFFCHLRFWFIKSTKLNLKCITKGSLYNTRGQMNSRTDYSARHRRICIWGLTQQMMSIAKPFRENNSILVLFYTPLAKKWRSYLRAMQVRWQGTTRRAWWMSLKSIEYSHLVFSLHHLYSIWKSNPQPCKMEVIEQDVYNYILGQSWS